MALPATQGYSSGGSVNSAQNSAYGYTTGYSNTFGQAASQWSANQAQIANAYQKALMNESMAFNSQEAALQRDWMEYMANTVYQRTVADMKAAGINPILAAGMGLGAGSVGSGAVASIGTPSAYMGQTFADQHSANNGENWAEGESHGSSWQNSESGFATFLEAMAGLATSMLDSIGNAQNIDVIVNNVLKDGLLEGWPTNDNYEGSQDGKPKAGYTKQYDSEKGKYLTEQEVASESFLEGLVRGFQNLTNARLGISGSPKTKRK